MVPPGKLAWIVLVVVYLSYSVVAGSFMASGRSSAMDQAGRPSAAIVKVMSVPDSRCIRVVTPDNHVNIGFHGHFHEVLLHDMEGEELGCLRIDRPKTLFVFMSRYQHDLVCLPPTEASTIGMQGMLWMHAIGELYSLWKVY